MNRKVPAHLYRSLQRLTLAQRFMLASLGILVLGMLGLGAWVSQQIRTGVINRAGATTALYVDSFVAPLLQELGQTGQLSPQNVDTLNRLLRETSLGRQIVAFKVWNLDGRVVYSTDPSAVGVTFPMHAALIEASQGNVSTRISAEDEENAPQRALHPELLEIYSPVRRTGTNQVIAIAEYYQTTADLHGEIVAAQRRSWLIVAAVMGLIYLLLSGFVRRASDTIESQQQALNRQIVQLQGLLSQNQALSERVRRAAARISTIHERLLRRVGAELHDGPAQDLGLALLQMDTLIGHFERQPDAAAQRDQLVRIQSMLQNTLKEMRSIAAGLSLPQLAELDLHETLVRVVRAHERRTGSKVDLSMEAVPDEASLHTKIAVYRIVQEALNNAHRHAGGTGQEVRVRSEGEHLLVEVCDQGPGFDLADTSAIDGHLGLAGMRDRVESLGGSFQVESAAGSGARIAVRLPLQAEGETGE